MKATIYTTRQSNHHSGKYPFRTTLSNCLGVNSSPLNQKFTRQVRNSWKVFRKVSYLMKVTSEVDEERKLHILLLILGIWNNFISTFSFYIFCTKKKLMSSPTSYEVVVERENYGAFMLIFLVQFWNEWSN